MTSACCASPTCPRADLSDVTMERLLAASHERKVLGVRRDEKSDGHDHVP